MEKYFKDKADDEVHGRAVWAQKIIIVAMIIFTILPFFLAWLSGSLRFWE